MAISETQNTARTYFWNGYRSGKIDVKGEDYIEIPRTGPFEERPWMKAAEITDRTVEDLSKVRPHTAELSETGTWWDNGGLQAAKLPVEAVDLCIGRLIAH